MTDYRTSTAYQRAPAGKYDGVKHRTDDRRKQRRRVRLAKHVAEKVDG